jgi:hypothetical protein
MKGSCRTIIRPPDGYSNLLDELSIVPEMESSLGLDANAFSKNTVCSDPAVDSTAIIADLKPSSTDGLHEV